MSIVRHISLWLAIAEMMLCRAMLIFVCVDDVISISTVKLSSIKLLPVSIQNHDSWPILIMNSSGGNASDYLGVFHYVVDCLNLMDIQPLPLCDTCDQPCWLAKACIITLSLSLSLAVRHQCHEAKEEPNCGTIENWCCTIHAFQYWQL